MKKSLIYFIISIKTIVLLSMFTGCKGGFLTSADRTGSGTGEPGQVFYFDSVDGNDHNNGISPETAWKTPALLDSVKLFPGAVIHFKRGSEFTGPITIKDSGNDKQYILLRDYGNQYEPPPAFTNPAFQPATNNFGNCIRLKASYIKLENLYFHNTVAELPESTGSFLVIWELGAVFIDKSAQHCIVRNNELYNCGVGIKSYGSHILIENNFIHDCNHVLKKWSWGPIGIWLGSDNQEVCFNRIYNYRTVHPEIGWGPDGYGRGADGGAIEIDDARFDKQNISIHHNYSRDCQGFLEVTWTDVEINPCYRNFEIHHNVSDDYQQFVALWRGANCKIDNNTIIRRKRNVNDWGVFNITQSDSKNLIRNNIIVVENKIVVFNLGQSAAAKPENIIENNLYFAASGSLEMGLEGPGKSAIIADPEFKNYNEATEAVDFSLRPSSPAINKGQNLDYKYDFKGTSLPQDNKTDIGAFEFKQD